MASKPDGPAREPDPVADFGLDGDGDVWLEHLRRAQRALELGKVGEYELLEEIGRGGQGIVYRARLRGGEPCAVKRLLRGSWASESERRRFEREVAATADLDHPGIVRVLGLDEESGEPVLSMEWIDGKPVNRWVAEHIPGRETERVLPLFREICDAVQHAHRNGVIHRDIKPSNVLVDEAGRPHLLDFGLARRERVEDGARLTLSAQVLGTPTYAAPEQLRAERAVDARADVYSLGVVLWELLTGELPYVLPPEPSGWLPAIEASEDRRASAVRPGLGRELDTILSKSMAREPARRYASVDAFSEDLRRLLAGEPILAHPPSALYQLTKLARRHAWPTAFALTLFVLAIAFGAWSVVQAGRLEDQRDRARGAEKSAVDALDAATLARDEARRAGELAQAEARRAEAVLDFFLEDVLREASPLQRLGQVDLGSALERVELRLGEEFADDPLTRADIHFAVGQIQYDLYLMDRAKENLGAAADLREQALGAGALSTLEARVAYGAALMQSGRLDLGREVLEACRDAADESVAPHWHARKQLGMLALLQGRQRDAVVELEAVSGARSRGIPGLDDPRDELMILYTQLGDHERAERAGREWIANAERHPTLQTATAVAGNRVQLAKLLLDQGRIEEAESEALAARGALSQVMEPDHPTAVLAGIALGEIRVAQARYAEAEELYRAALFATRRREGPSSLRTTETGNMLASFLRRRGRGEEAVALYRAQLADMEQHGEQESDTYPQVQMRLAATLMDAGANDEARALLDGALPALREGDLHAERRALLVLSILCREQQDCARILEILPRMREVALAYHGSAQPSLVEDLESIALDAQLCEDTGLALSVQEQAVDLAAEHGSLDARELSLSRWRLSWYRARTGDFEGARASARSALLELGELDAALTPLYELTRDWLGLQLGDVERATVLEELDALGGQGWELPPPALSFAELRRAVDAVR